MYGGADHEKAGEIATETLRKVKSIIKVGRRIADIANEIEDEIRALGGEPAFPCSIAINDFAAHCAPLYNDSSAIPENSIIKVDLGVHINGYICDCATTINLNSSLNHIERASIDGLKAGVESIKAGITLSEIGAAIHEAVSAHNATPIFNLSGHNLGQYVVHAGLSIPNHRNDDSRVLREGDVIAIEPFATNGEGYVSNHGRAGIFSILEVKNVRNSVGRKILHHMYERRKTLPFAERWLHSIENSQFAILNALRDLLSFNAITDYPPLRESSGGMVSQHECTVLVENDGFHVIGGAYA